MLNGKLQLLSVFRFARLKTGYRNAGLKDVWEAMFHSILTFIELFFLGLFRGVAARHSTLLIYCGKRDLDKKGNDLEKIK